MKRLPMWMLILLAVFGGMAIALQALVNARLQQSAGNSVLAATISFGVGFVALALALSTQSVRGHSLAAAPWWAWLGGLLGAFYIVMSIVLLPRIGAAALISAAVFGQMIFALIADHYGLLGTQVRSASLPRVMGAALLLAGVLLIRGRS